MNFKNKYPIVILIVLLNMVGINGYSIVNEKPLIFPVPSEVKINAGKFYLDKSTFLILPEKETKADGFLGKLFSNELADRYGYAIKNIQRSKFNAKDKFILIGAISNPLVKDYCEQKGLVSMLKGLGEEGYMLVVTENNVVVAGNTESGALLGLASLRQIIHKEEGGLSIPQLIVKDSPVLPFRGIKLYLPGKENIPFFKRFIKDFVALYKYNKIILELNANMRLERHPELNIGATEFAKHLKFSRLDRPPGVHKEYQNSSHQDNADGEILEKEEVADLVDYIRKFNIEVIPELPSLTHAYYLLSGHKDLAENMNQEYPDTYCPLKPEIYKIYFDVLDEYIDVIHPAMIHVGHDEWRMEKDICKLCRGKDYGQLFADDLSKIHNYLAKKGIKTAIWGDHLLESVTQKDHQTWKTSTGYEYKIPGALRPEQVLQLIPKDILIFNWFWNDVKNDKQLAAFGFEQVYGNLRPDIDTWDERKSIQRLSGGAPSSWAGTTEMNFGKDQLFDFLGCANLLWSKHYLPVDKLAFTTEPLISEIHANLSGKILPSNNGAKVNPVNISSKLNSSLIDGIAALDKTIRLKGNIKTANKIFDLNLTGLRGDKAIVVSNQNGETKTEGIQINKDVSSIIFLHASAREAANAKAYGMIYNFDDTAEPLGWYEVVYEDGMIENIPVRYGVNILDWRWRQRISNKEVDKVKYSQNKYAYAASAVNCAEEDSNPATFFSFEWENSRLGKVIKEVNLKAVHAKKGNENAIILLALSISENKKIADAKGTEAQ